MLDIDSYEGSRETSLDLRFGGRIEMLLFPHFTRVYSNCHLDVLAFKFQKDDLKNYYFTFV